MTPSHKGNESLSMSNWNNYLEDNKERFLGELMEFLKIPSISALPESAEDVQKAAEWLATRMTRAGIEDVAIMPTGGHPTVFGQWLHAPDKPTVLIYGHFDTQPVDPLDAWDTPPFEPTLKGDRLYARGSTDDKGHMFAPILAVEALLSTQGKLPINVKFMFEGEEESGSPNLNRFMEDNRELLASDLVISADSIQYSKDQPALLLSWKGMCKLQVNVFGPKRELHSGIYGGAVQNPIAALAHILDTMRTTDGAILVEGFYDDVVPLKDEIREQFASIPNDDDVIQSESGVPELVVESGFTAREATWARPTLEINGIWGGFTGEGSKTIIPTAAHAKISCRLVPNQDPERILSVIQEHIAKVAPVGIRCEVEIQDEGTKAYLMPMDHPVLPLASEVLEELYGKKPYLTRAGGTLPICASCLEILGTYSLMFGFILNDECAHAPNEFLRLSAFEMGQKAYAMLWEKLANNGL